MRDLMILTGMLMPRELLIEDLQKALDKYKEEKLLGKVDKETEMDLCMQCHLVSLNITTEGKEIKEVMDRWDNIEKADHLLNTDPM